MSKAFPKKVDKNFDASSSLTFWFYRVFGCFSAMGVQKHHKKGFTERSCRKVFTKKSTKNPKPIFPRFFCHVFGRFSVRAGQKHDKRNTREINPTLVLFWPLTYPPTTGVTDLFLRRPLEP
jgi:hypothetical protein